ncbi:MAG: T9SS type A sorting domain-containing protein, partial [Bacteroidia bacterium]|nr:T9SS type A sorting domain-containing protein [Bacteroidia bacterium]
VSKTTPLYTLSTTAAYTLSAYFDSNTAVTEVLDSKGWKVCNEPEKITVTWDGQILESCSLYSIDSKLIAKADANKTTCSIDTKHLNPGMYIVSVEVKNRTYTKKIQIQ